MAKRIALRNAAAAIVVDLVGRCPRVLLLVALFIMVLDFLRQHKGTDIGSFWHCRLQLNESNNLLHRPTLLQAAATCLLYVNSSSDDER
eukprot:scaffold41196_cov153-Skeletonema_marinoi.AAC.2